MHLTKPLYASLLSALLTGMSGGVSAYDELSQSLHVQANGNDPDWSLEIPADENRLTLTLDGQTATYRYPAIGPTLYTSGLTSVYRVPDEHHSLTVFVKGIACRDSKTGASREVTVIVSYDGKGYQGCGDILNR